MIWEALIRSYRDSKKKNVSSCGNPRMFHELDFEWWLYFEHSETRGKREGIFRQTGVWAKALKQGEARRAGAQFGEKRKEDKKGEVRAEGADIQSHIKYSECCLSGKGEPLMFLLRSWDTVQVEVGNSSDVGSGVAMRERDESTVTLSF